MRVAGLDAVGLALSVERLLSWDVCVRGIVMGVCA